MVQIFKRKVPSFLNFLPLRSWEEFVHLYLRQTLHTMKPQSKHPKLEQPNKPHATVNTCFPKRLYNQSSGIFRPIIDNHTVGVGAEKWVKNLTSLYSKLQHAVMFKASLQTSFGMQEKKNLFVLNASSRLDWMCRSGRLLAGGSGPV